MKQTQDFLYAQKNKTIAQNSSVMIAHNTAPIRPFQQQKASQKQ